ncbi:kinase-like domain-containing protein [Elsinoe ampelina]|uniref:EKC/KEOPS complex subunit BUD32 n=1 Tax=Elsinoe ampelina TaxID=302913 RepID=A0A6A6G3L3_9PEZI|nr:kinase-like domain-containing protein [Elsinoe ampelina]
MIGHRCSITRAMLRCLRPRSLRFHSTMSHTSVEVFEENSLPRWGRRRYYPVRIGDIYKDRYRIITKLGFGAHSTVWLARDERRSCYATLKVCTVEPNGPDPAVVNEIKMLDHLKGCPREDGGLTYLRLAEDKFELDGPHGQHGCLVMRPQGCSYLTLQRHFDAYRLPKEFVVDLLPRLMICLDWLHGGCGIVHTDISATNVLVGTEDDQVFARLEQDEKNNPSLPTKVDGHDIYPSRGNPGSIYDVATGKIVLTDFGSARLIQDEHRGWCMPDTHRAPEVLMGLLWNWKIDIWSVGITALELLEGRHLFYPIDHRDNKYVLPIAVAQYISYLGPPPLHMVERSENPAIKILFDGNGQWVGPIAIPDNSLEDFVTAIPEGDHKVLFLDLIRKMLVWDPEERGDAADVFHHEWFQSYN